MLQVYYLACTVVFNSCEREGKEAGLGRKKVGYEIISTMLSTKPFGISGASELSCIGERGSGLDVPWHQPVNGKTVIGRYDLGREDSVASQIWSPIMQSNKSLTYFIFLIYGMLDLSFLTRD